MVENGETCRIGSVGINVDIARERIETAPAVFAAVKHSQRVECKFISAAAHGLNITGEHQRPGKRMA